MWPDFPVHGNEKEGGQEDTIPFLISMCMLGLTLFNWNFITCCGFQTPLCYVRFFPLLICCQRLPFVPDCHLMFVVCSILWYAININHQGWNSLSDYKAWSFCTNINVPHRGADSDTLTHIKFEFILPNNPSEINGITGRIKSYSLWIRVLIWVIKYGPY